MEVRADDFRRLYESLSDDALLSLKREDLVQVAQECYDQELASRELSNAAAASEAPQQEGSGRVEGLVEVTTYSSFQEANLARSMLEAAAIPVFLENESFATGGLRLMVPLEFLEQAREALETQLSDEELAAQAEAEPPPEE